MKTCRLLEIMWFSGNRVLYQIFWKMKLSVECGEAKLRDAVFIKFGKNYGFLSIIYIRNSNQQAENIATILEPVDIRNLNSVKFRLRPDLAAI